MEMKHSSPSTIFSLKDDLIMEIIKYLPLNDLCSMKGVCRRLQFLAKKSFYRQYSNHIQFDDLLMNLGEITRIVKHFGEYMKSITIDGSVAFPLNTSLINSLNKHCGCRLVKLRLNFFHVDKPTAIVLKALAERLETVELFYCTINSTQVGANYGTIFRTANQLKEFVIVGRNEEIDLKFINKKWKSIEKLQIFGARLIDDDVLVGLLRKNPGVRCLMYLPDEPVQSRTSWLNLILKSSLSLNIEELTIEMFPGEDISYLLSKMTNLQRITINCRNYTESICPVINTLTEIETLSLHGVDFDDFIMSSRMSNIKSLELCEIKNLHDRNRLASSIKNAWKSVVNLSLDHSIVRNADDLGVFVEALPTLQTLYLRNMKTFDLLPDALQYQSWCSKWANKLNIFVDSRFLTHRGTIVPSQQIEFRPLKDHFAQTVDIFSSADFN